MVQDTIIMDLTTQIILVTALLAFIMLSGVNNGERALSITNS